MFFYFTSPFYYIALVLSSSCFDLTDKMHGIVSECVTDDDIFNVCRSGRDSSYNL